MEIIAFVVRLAGAAIAFSTLFAFGLLSSCEGEPRAVRLSFLSGTLISAALASSAILPVHMRTILVVLLVSVLVIIPPLLLWPARRIEADIAIGVS